VPEAKTPRKAAAKKTTARKRGPIAPPKPPVTEPVETIKEEGPVSEENVVAVDEDKPKRGRKPNVVGQANARYQKAIARLKKAEAKAAKVQSVQDELNAAKAEFEESKEAYEAAFRASLDLPSAE